MNTNPNLSRLHTSMSVKIPDTLQLIREMRLRGGSIRAIVDYLNRVKAPTARPGSVWNIRQVQLALRQLGIG